MPELYPTQGKTRQDTTGTAPSLRSRLQTGWRRIRWRKIGLFILSLFLFVLAITLMKAGSQSLTPLIRDRFAIDNPANSLGFGWLFAYAIMSGSPVAAAALTFFDAGVIDQLSTYTMITGSRLGSSFIVIFIGFIYVLRGRDRVTSLGMGLLSFTITGTIHFLALFIGWALLQSALLAHVQLSSGAVLSALTDYIFDPIIALLSTVMPNWALFVLGLVIIIGSFALFDKCLPQMSLKESQVGRVSRLVYRPFVMFTLGGLLTLVSMSVSVSLSILVPLSARGFVRRENVIPYIMGANVTTFIDTLLAAVLLDNPQAFTVVLVQMVSVTLVSLLLLVTMFRRYERMVLRFMGWITLRDRHLALFMLTIFIIPALLLFV